MPEFDLSIIVPHYENSSDLERLLVSIPLRNQRFEVIVVDDYSSEACYQRLLALNERYSFKFLRNNRNKSAGACRNIGLAEARGKQIIFADSDDFFLPALEEQVYKFLDTDFDIVFFAPTSMYSDSNKICKRHLPYVGKIMEYVESKSSESEKRLRLNWHSPWSRLFKTEFLRENDIWFDEVIAANDVVFSLLSGIHAKAIGVSTVPVYCVTSRGGSLIKCHSREILEARIRVSARHRKICQQIGAPENGANVLQWLYFATKLKFSDFLYLTKLAKKLGAFSGFDIYQTMTRCFNSFIETNIIRYGKSESDD